MGKIKNEDDLEDFVNISVGNIAYSIQSRLDALPKKYQKELISQLLRWLNTKLKDLS